MKRLFVSGSADWPQDLGESAKEASEVSKRGERLRVFFMGASIQLRVRCCNFLVPAVRRTWLGQPFKDVWRLDFFQQAATASAADDGNAEESNAWFLDVADVSGMLHEAALRSGSAAACTGRRIWASLQEKPARSASGERD